MWWTADGRNKSCLRINIRDVKEGTTGLFLHTCISIQEQKCSFVSLCHITVPGCWWLGKGMALWSPTWEVQHGHLIFQRIYTFSTWRHLSIRFLTRCTNVKLCHVKWEVISSIVIIFDYIWWPYLHVSMSVIDLIEKVCLCLLLISPYWVPNKPVTFKLPFGDKNLWDVILSFHRLPQCAPIVHSNIIPRRGGFRLLPRMVLGREVKYG